jgi:effector-binding domain-containing protein
VRVGEVAVAWRPALDLVWAFLRAHEGLRTGGHNVFVYHHAAQAGALMDVEFGVEVSRPFEADGEVVSSHTPAGCVASTLHVGPYSGLAAANAAIEAWCAAHGHRLAGSSWETYGDPGPDPGRAEVRVSYLLGDPKPTDTVCMEQSAVIPVSPTLHREVGLNPSGVNKRPRRFQATTGDSNE